ncbi:unnamed protein product [Pocillopora meandrina]|uniref:Potassium channel domain-containing protein n=1 Tax=Pocillopora meandrina TaxID=46732 RepID=A0AAU9WP17_9CNID|nr:unnamed protein product [Pocillopora meandrina]
MFSLLFLIATLTKFAPETEAIFLPYWSKRNHSETSFHIPLSTLAMDKPFGRSKKLQHYFDLATNYSLDNRCTTGLPISIAWHLYSPYTTVYRTKNKGSVGLSVDGMFPGILKAALSGCCNKSSEVLFGKFSKSVRSVESDIEKDTFDLTFPIYGYDNSDIFRDRPFISIVKAPRVILLVHNEQPDKTQTHVLITTIANAWPMLVFILVTASLSGIIIWFLDHTSNPGEFPPPFLRGSWEGFWWALVTMTTVGYGDRSPKSALGRVFCILWIITGVIIISIFTALVTASLSASTVQIFKIHGSKIGAVNGSEEFKLGVTMNADMKVFPHVMKMTEALLAHEIDGALVDNYVLTHSLNLIQKEPIRIERYIDHSITYGVVLPKNSSRFEKCVRSFLQNHPQEIFEIIADNLVPLKNPTDDENQQLKAAEGLFYQEDVFSLVMYIGLGVAAVFFIAGFSWEFLYRRPKIRNQRMQFAPKGSYSVSEDEVKLHPRDNSKHATLDMMIAEYQVFHDRLIEGLKKLRDQELAADRNSNGRTPNGDDEKVAV